MTQSRIVTAPDMDLDTRFKILLLDVDWEDIQKLSAAVESLGVDITIFLYGSNDNDDMWCINAAKHANCVLVNSRFSGTKELLKGWLLAQRNTYSLGSNDIALASHRYTYDIYSWLITQYDNYFKEEKNAQT